MPTKEVIFRDNQEVQSADFINMQDWITQSMDSLILDAIEGGQKYAGFTITKTAQTQVTIQPGRLYTGGVCYENEAPSLLDFFSVLPVSQQKQIAIIAWGQTLQTDIQPRDFIIDADTGTSQPQSVAMQSDRYCNVGQVAGVESSQPQNPVISSNQLLIGYVLCDPTGVVSFQQSLATQIDSVDDLSNRAGSLEVWKSQISGQVNTLATALANIAGQLGNYVLAVDYTKIVTLVNEIWNLVHQPAAYIWYGTDNFLDTSLSATTSTLDGTYSASVTEGLRFPGGTATATSVLTLLNPSDPGVYVYDNFAIPTPSGSVVRMDCGFTNLPWIPERILQYTYWSFSVRKLRPSRYLHRCGLPFIPSPLAQVWWYQAQLDPTTRILSFASETWELEQWSVIAQHMEDDVDWPRHIFERYQYYWRDYVDLPYWSKTFDNFAHSGNHICQTFMNSQDGWLTGLSLFMHTNLAQPITIIISGCDAQGVPDQINQTLMRVVLDGPTVQTSFDAPQFIGDFYTLAGWSLAQAVSSQYGITHNSLGLQGPLIIIPQYIYPIAIRIPPTFLRAGQKYAIHILSTYDHSFSISDQWDPVQVHQGEYWVSGSGGLFRWPQAPRSLRFALHYATWGQWQGQTTTTAGISKGMALSVIGMQPLTKVGGIDGIEVLAEVIEPTATDLSYQIQVAGTWQPFSSDPNSPQFAGNPALLPFQIVFSGTTDLMPAVSLTNSQVTLHAPRATTFHHVSTDIPLGTTSTHVKTIAKVLGFVSAHHTLSCSINYGTAPGTHHVADAFVDVINDDGSLERTWTFNVSGGITEFHVELDGVTDGTIDPFIVAQRIAYASP